jgi:hypothetical protein
MLPHFAGLVSVNLPAITGCAPVFAGNVNDEIKDSSNTLIRDNFLLDVINSSSGIRCGKRRTHHARRC